MEAIIIIVSNYSGRTKLLSWIKDRKNNASDEYICHLFAGQHYITIPESDMNKFYFAYSC